MSKELNKAPVEQAGGDERVIGWRERILAAHPNSDPGFWPDALLVEHMAAEIADLRAALAQPSPTPELPERGTQHRFSTNEQNCRHDFAGVWWNDNGETKTGRECRHCGFFVADVAEAAAEQAEAERPEVVAWRYGSSGGILSDKACLDEWKSGGEYQSLMTVAQHERIVKAWIERWKAYIELSAKIAAQRDAADARLHEVATACATAEQERDAALARVAELTATRNRYGVDAHYFNKNLQRILRDFESFTPDELARSLIILAKVADEKVVAQHSVLEKQEPVATIAKVPGEDWNGLHFYRDLQGMQPGTKLYAAPVAQAQQLHDLDKQCRDDVARALGLRPSQERGFAWSYLLASIKSCVKASEDAAQAQHSVPDDDMILQIFADNAEHSEQGDEHGYCIVREQHAQAIARKLLAAAPGNSAQHSVPEGYALIPVRETEAMHDAVMALLYKGVARTDTQKLLDAYIAAAPGKEGV